MKKILLTIFILLSLMPVLIYAEEAQTQTPSPSQQPLVNTNLPNIPGTEDLSKGGPAALIYNIYIIALWLGGALAFGSILFAGIQYLSARGSTEAVSSAKGRIQNAILGLLLLLGMYILLSIINPDLTRLRLPTLDKLPEAKINPLLPQFPPDQDVFACKDKAQQANIFACYTTANDCTRGCLAGIDPKTQANNSDIRICVKVKGKECNVLGGVTTSPSTNATCQQHAADPTHAGAKSCSDSPGVAKVKGCILANMPKLTAGTNFFTYEGKHAGNSCHFGGRDCKDGSHAIDVGVNGAKLNGKTLEQARATAEACAQINKQSISCRYENGNGSTVQYGDPSMDHIHCNVNTESCRCN